MNCSSSEQPEVCELVQHFDCIGGIGAFGRDLAEAQIETSLLINNVSPPNELSIPMVFLPGNIIDFEMVERVTRMLRNRDAASFIGEGNSIGQLFSKVFRLVCRNPIQFSGACHAVLKVITHLSKPFQNFIRNLTPTEWMALMVVAGLVLWPYRKSIGRRILDVFGGGGDGGDGGDHGNDEGTINNRNSIDEDGEQLGPWCEMLDGPENAPRAVWEPQYGRIILGRTGEVMTTVSGGTILYRVRPFREESAWYRPDQFTIEDMETHGGHNLRDR